MVRRFDVMALIVLTLMVKNVLVVHHAHVVAKKAGMVIAMDIGVVMMK